MAAIRGARPSRLAIWIARPGALESHDHAADAHDRCHYADLQAGLLEVRALFDVGFEVADVPIMIDLDSRHVGQPDPIERISDRLAVVVR